MNTETLIEKLTKAISYYYREDKTSPGLTISKLKNSYYCSIIRYEGAFNTKVVVCKSTGDTLHIALQNVVNLFLDLAYQPRNPVQDLSVFVRESHDS